MAIQQAARLPAKLCSTALLLVKQTLSCYYTIMHRQAVIEQLQQTRETLDKLLAMLESSEHDKFVAHLYQARREYRHVSERAGKAIERSVISTFQIAQSLGFKGELRQWEHLLRVGD